MSLGTYCRGGPPWPPVVLTSSPNSRSLLLEFLHKPRAATEGRPYSTFRVTSSLRVNAFFTAAPSGSLLK
jgi:hypothetical protein